MELPRPRDPRADATVLLQDGTIGNGRQLQAIARQGWQIRSALVRGDGVWEVRVRRDS